MTEQDRATGTGRTRKPRIAVVFGGRSERARDLVRDGRQRAAGHRPRPLRRGPGRHHPRRALGARVGRPGAARDHLGRQAAGGRRLSRDGRDRAATDPRSELVVHEPGAVPAHPRRGRRRLPAAARPVGRGRHDPGAAGDGGRALRRRGCARLRRRHGQALHEGGPAGARPAGAAVRRHHRARLGARPAGLSSRRSTRWATRSSSSRAAAARASASARCARATSSTRPSRRPRRHDPKVLVEAAAEGGREVECGVLQGFGDEPAGRVGGRRDHRRPATTTFYDFAAKYLPEESTTLDRARPTCRATSRHASSELVGRRLRGAVRARGWPGWTSSCWRTTGWCSTRSTPCRGSPRRRCSRGCGTQRAVLPRARRPADPARAAPRHRPALSAALTGSGLTSRMVPPRPRVPDRPSRRREASSPRAR